jgi:hypothetical protein
MTLACVAPESKIPPFLLQGSSLIPRTDVIEVVANPVEQTTLVPASQSFAVTNANGGHSLLSSSSPDFYSNVQYISMGSLNLQCGVTEVPAPQYVSMTATAVQYFSGGGPAIHYVWANTPAIQDVSIGTLARTLVGLRDVVSAIREARALPSTPAFDALLTRVASSHRPEPNIASWAQRLAEDVGDLND